MLDKIALIITLTISIVLMMVIAKPLITGVALAPEVAKMTAHLIGSLVAIVSMYVGAKLRNNKKDE